MELQDRFYTSTEVAEILGVSLRSVYRYLEEDKLLADVKTATGRHRFTKQNILDFLYPKGDIPETTAGNVTSDVSLAPTGSEESVSKEDSPLEGASAESTSEIDKETSEQEQENEDEDEVDWLAKFRAAAKKHRAQVAQDSNTEDQSDDTASETDEKVEEKAHSESETKTEEPVNESSEESTNGSDTSVEETITQSEVQKETLSSLTSSDDTDESSNEQPTEAEETALVTYYKSELGGLKELAQYINKTAKKSSVQYAFTLNAGLSLHKLIRPFSLLHIYAKSDDIEFFEKALELSKTDKNNAQLGIFTDTTGVLNDKKEMHGLYVVSDLQLRKDLLDEGEVDLASELDSVLNA